MADQQAPASGDSTTGRKKKPAPTTWHGKLWHNWIKPIGLAVLVVFGFRSVFIDWNDVPSASMEPTILVGDRVFVNKMAYGLQIPFSTLFGGPWWIVRWDEPNRGDIVVFFQEQTEPGGQIKRRRFIKRIVGAPGDVIEMRQNVLIVNGEAVETQPTNVGRLTRLDLEPLRDRTGRFEGTRFNPAGVDFENEVTGEVVHPVMYVGGKGNENAMFATFGPVTIPEGQYLMVGDNRNNSRDGRRVDDRPDSQNGFGFVDAKNIVGRAFGTAFSIDKVPSFGIRWDRFFRGLNQEPASAAGAPARD